MHTYFQWKKSNVDPKSFPAYVRWISLFMTVLNKESDYTLDDISRFKLFLENALYSPRNIQFGLYIIHDYIHYLVSMGELTFPIHLFRIKVERSVSHTPISEIDYKSILALLPINTPISLQRRLMLMLLHDTGMRVGELLRLRISDLRKRSAIINNEKNKRQRLVAWSDATEATLVNYLHLRKELQRKEDWLFTSFQMQRNHSLTTRSVQRILKGLCVEAGIKTKLSPHSFRHRFVHRQLEDGKPITTVSQMLGHSTTHNVLTYAQLSSVEIKDAWGI